MDERRDIEEMVDEGRYDCDLFADEVAEAVWDYATDPEQIVPW